jgi:antitoxin HicB
MEYRARWTQEGHHHLVEFPDLLGCATFGSSEDECRTRAEEALALWLETCVDDGDPVPRPAFADGVPIPIPAPLAFAIQLRWRREELGLSQAAVAKRLGVTQQAYGKLERSDADPRLSTLDKLARIGLKLSLEIAVPALPPLAAGG